MKFFAILFCIAIGSVFGELQRPGFEKEKLEVTEDVNEARSLISLDDRRKPYNSDESLRVKYALDSTLDQIAVNTKDADSVEKETPRKPSSVIDDTSTVKPTSSKAIKKNLEIKYLGKPETHFKMLRKTAKPEDNRSEGERKTLNDFFKSILRGTDALNLKETNLARKERRALRRKRDTERPPTKVEDPTNIVESLKAYRKLRDKLPVSLIQEVRRTDKWDEELLKYYAKTGPPPKDRCRDIFLRRERTILYNLVSNQTTEDEAWEIINNYRALRKGSRPLWNFIGLRPSFQKFVESGVREVHNFMLFKQKEYSDVDLTKILGIKTEKLQDSSDPTESHAHYNELMVNIGTRELFFKLHATDKAELNMLSKCAETNQIPKDLVDAYYEARKSEFQQFKEELDKYVLKRKRFKEGYNLMRKGSVWAWLSEQYYGILYRDSQCGTQYIAIKKEEQYTDQYLDGSMKIGEVPKKDENARAEAFEKASSQTKSEKTNRKLRAEVAELARAEEDEKAEEMERGVRAKETEIAEAEYDAYRENVANVVTTSDDAKEDSKVHESPDNVTLADATNTETITDTKTKDNSHLLRFAILFAIFMQVIIAILILAPQRDKLVECCKIKRKTESGPSETEPLQAGEKVFATGPTSKILKVSSQRRPDVADANQ